MSPCFAIRVNRLALPRRFEENEEKTSFYHNTAVSLCLGAKKGKKTNRMVECVVIMGVVVDINRHRFEGRYFAGEGVEESIVLSGFVC